jgi:hypothetical protein
MLVPEWAARIEGQALLFTPGAHLNSIPDSGYIGRRKKVLGLSIAWSSHFGIHLPQLIFIEFAIVFHTVSINLIDEYSSGYKDI